MTRSRKKNLEEIKKEPIEKKKKTIRTDAFKKVSKQVHREKEKKFTKRNPELAELNKSISVELTKINNITKSLNSSNKTFEEKFKELKRRKRNKKEDVSTDALKIIEFLLNNQKESIKTLKEEKSKFFDMRIRMIDFIKNSDTLISDIVDQFDNALNSDDPEKFFVFAPNERNKTSEEFSKTRKLCMENENSSKDSMFLKFPKAEVN